VWNRLVSDIAIFVLKRDVKLQLTNSCVEVWSATAENRRGKRRKKKKPQDENIMACPIPSGGHNKRNSRPRIGKTG